MSEFVHDHYWNIGQAKPLFEPLPMPTQEEWEGNWQYGKCESCPMLIIKFNRAEKEVLRSLLNRLSGSFYMPITGILEGRYTIDPSRIGALIREFDDEFYWRYPRGTATLRIKPPQSERKQGKNVLGIIRKLKRASAFSAHMKAGR
mgnify:CR=1 FL=1